MAIRVKRVTATANSVTVYFTKNVKKGDAENRDNFALECPVGYPVTLSESALFDYKDNSTTITGLNLTPGQWVKAEVTKTVTTANGQDRLTTDKIDAKGFGRVAGSKLGDNDRFGDFTDLSEISSYPVLTKSIDDVTVKPSSGTGSGAPLSNVVNNALKNILGRLPRQEDPRSFRAALEQSFKISEFEGHTAWEWTPKSYVGQSDLGGGVTGAQASLVSFARVALSTSLPLLDGLTSLLPDPDFEEVEAARSILRSDWNELIEELQTEGGPRAARGNALTERLKQFHLPNLGVQLGMVETDTDNRPIFSNGTFIISRKHVITIDEETNLTNFIALRDYIFSVDRSWNYYRDNSQQDMGTGLVLLSRALSVVAESVGEVYMAMDSVFVDEAERLVAVIDLRGRKDLLVEELLSWVLTFASEEGPYLVQVGGVRGAESIKPTLDELRELIGQFIGQLDRDGRLPVGLRHPRVRNPLNEIMSYLDVAVEKARLLAAVND